MKNMESIPATPIADAQEALAHGPGLSSALLLFDRLPHASSADVRKIAARVMRAVEPANLPQNLFVLVAVGVDALDPSLAHDVQSAKTTPHAERFPRQQHDLLIQVAAHSEADRVLALRTIDTAIAAEMVTTQEIFGARIFRNQEHFGFPDGAIPEPSTVQHVMHTRKGCWLFHVQFEQHLNEFFSLTEQERINAVGRLPSHLEDPDPASRAVRQAKLDSSPITGSHYTVMHGKPLLRRGFPCRTLQGQRAASGLAFLAACANPEDFYGALDDMVSGNDKLLTYITGSGGGAYFCAPSADFLGSSASASAAAKTTPSLQHGARLTTYEVSSSFLDYVDLVRYGLFVGDIGAMKFEGRAAELIKQLHVVISENLKAQGGTVPQATPQQLDDALELARNEANELNQHVGEYLTVS